MKQAGSQMRPISPRSGSGGARRGSRSQIEVCVNDSSNSLSCVMLTARLSWINSDAHSRPWHLVSDGAQIREVKCAVLLQPWRSILRVRASFIAVVSFSSSFISQLLRLLLVYYFLGLFCFACFDHCTINVKFLRWRVVKTSSLD